MKVFFHISFLLAAGFVFSIAQTLRASDLYSFVPRNSACALFLDLTEQNRRMPVIQENLEKMMGEQDKGLLQSNNLKIKDICSSMVVSMPSLVENDGYVIAKTALPEQRLRELFQKSKIPDFKYTAGKYNNRNVHILSFSTKRISKGVEKVRVRTFALMYVAPDIIVVTKDSIVPYFKEPRGLPRNLLQLLKVPGAFASGFAVTDDSFQAENPFLPPTKLNSFSASFGGRENIVLKSEFLTASQQDANQTMLLLQQYILLAGLFLNNENPALMQELTNSFKLQNKGLTVTMNGSLSKEFFVLLGNSASNIQERLEQQRTAKKSGAQNHSQP